MTEQFPMESNDERIPKPDDASDRMIKEMIKLGLNDSDICRIFQMEWKALVGRNLRKEGQDPKHNQYLKRLSAYESSGRMLSGFPDFIQRKIVEVLGDVLNIDSAVNYTQNLIIGMRLQKIITELDAVENGDYTQRLQSAMSEPTHVPFSKTNLLDLLASQSFMTLANETNVHDHFSLGKLASIVSENSI